MKVGLRFWSVLLTLALVIIPTTICGGLLYFYLKSELDNRRMISFMNFEQLAHRLDRSLDGFSAFTTETGALKFQREPLALMQKNGSKLETLQGKSPEGLITQGLADSSCDVQNISGQLYLLCPVALPQTLFQSRPIAAGYYFALWSLEKDDLSVFDGLTPARAFLLDRRGKPVYQSDRAEPEAALLKKPLVQEFIRTPLTKSGSAPYNDAGTQVLGFAMHLSRSNLTLFVESPAALVFAPMWKPSTWFLATLFFGVGLLLILGRFFIMNIRDQVQVLSTSFRDFSMGLQIPTQHQTQDFFLDFEPMVTAMNQGTYELKLKLEQLRTEPTEQPAPSTEPTS